VGQRLADFRQGQIEGETGPQENDRRQQDARHQRAQVLLQQEGKGPADQPTAPALLDQSPWVGPAKDQVGEGQEAEEEHLQPHYRSPPPDHRPVQLVPEDQDAPGAEGEGHRHGPPAEEVAEEADPGVDPAAGGEVDEVQAGEQGQHQ